MEREECEKQIRDLMIQIHDIYKEYNPGGTYLNIYILGNKILANNMKYTDDADHPLDIYYIIK